ncbi:cytochrome P450 3A27-like isoform X2 [Anguilla rostrata]
MDTGMIKTILVKECYSVFTNRRNLGLNGSLYDAVSIAEDDEWKRIRSVLSPSFTSGRLKEMFAIMTQHSNNLIKSLQKKVNHDESVEVKDFFGSYSMDVVTSTAFSVDIDSLNNPGDPFVAHIKKMVKFDLLNPFLLLVVLFPFLTPLMEKLGVSLFPTSSADFFLDSLRKIKADREKNVHKSRVDFLQLMVDSQISEEGATSTEEKSGKGLTDHEILSQALIFIFAGYETSSSSLSFIAYLMATRRDIQKKLQDEIDEVFPNKAPIKYEAMMQMEYLDMVINESMRMYPIGLRVERMCKKTVEINGVTIPKGTVIAIPAYSLHHDPTLWPEPETFKPERFSKDNKESIDPYAYLPFGAGPRNCIGMRFAVIMMKLALVQILQNFSFAVCEDTPIPLELEAQGFLQPKKPIKLKLVPRIPANNKE